METTIASTSRQNLLSPGNSTPLPYIPYLRHSHCLSTAKKMARHQTWTVTPILKHKRRFNSYSMRKHAATQILSQSTMPHSYYLSLPLSAPHHLILAWASQSLTSQSNKSKSVYDNHQSEQVQCFFLHFGHILRYKRGHEREKMPSSYQNCPVTVKPVWQPAYWAGLLPDKRNPWPNSSNQRGKLKEFSSQPQFFSLPWARRGLL